MRTSERIRTTAPTEILLPLLDRRARDCLCWARIPMETWSDAPFPLCRSCPLSAYLSDPDCLYWAISALFNFYKIIKRSRKFETEIFERASGGVRTIDGRSGGTSPAMKYRRLKQRSLILESSVITKRPFPTQTRIQMWTFGMATRFEGTQMAVHADLKLLNCPHKHMGVLSSLFPFFFFFFCQRYLGRFIHCMLPGLINASRIHLFENKFLKLIR